MSTISTKPKILAFAGSARAESLNKKLALVAAECAREAGAEVTVADFAELELPLYEQGYQQKNGFHENALKFKELVRANDALLIVSPEHNGSTPALLKNALDWASRAEEGEKALEVFDGKVAALMSAAPGALGGVRGLTITRAILSGFKLTLLPDQLAIGRARDKFDDSGALTDDAALERVRAITQKLVATARRVRS